MSKFNIPAHADPADVLEAINAAANWLLTRGTQAEALRQIARDVEPAAAVYDAATMTGEYVADMFVEMAESIRASAPKVAGDLADSVKQAIERAESN